MKTKVTRRELNRILADAAYLGYSSLDDREKKIADAFDAGTLVVTD